MVILAVVAVDRPRNKVLQEVMVVMVEEDQVVVTPSYHLQNNLIQG
tara:strand:- start:138 stop:275 length:138 start_codon:yes stop_codon:yes gene_type:complete